MLSLASIILFIICKQSDSLLAHFQELLLSASVYTLLTMAAGLGVGTVLKVNPADKLTLMMDGNQLGFYWGIVMQYFQVHNAIDERIFPEGKSFAGPIFPSLYLRKAISRDMHNSIYHKFEFPGFFFEQFKLYFPILSHRCSPLPA